MESRKESFEMRVNFSSAQGERMVSKLTAMDESGQRQWGRSPGSRRSCHPFNPFSTITCVALWGSGVGPCPQPYQSIIPSRADTGSGMRPSQSSGLGRELLEDNRRLFLSLFVLKIRPPKGQQTQDRTVTEP